MDIPASPPPAVPPREPPAYVYAAGDIYPRTTREEELCKKASQPDWLYIGTLVALDTGAIYLASEQLKYRSDQAVRMLGPVLVGATWGATLSGAYLSLPKCSPHWVHAPPREGPTRSPWPLAFAIGLASAATAPIVLGIAIGPRLPLDWSTNERAARVVVASATAFASSFLPYLISPRTWSAYRELERLRMYGDDKGAFLGYAVQF